MEMIKIISRNEAALIAVNLNEILYLIKMIYGSGNGIPGFTYLNLTIAFFCSVEVMRTSKRCSPAVTIIKEVLGGMRPRFSATITNSCSGFDSSIFRLMAIAAVDNLLFDNI